jgi:hypothetical protein
VARANRPLFISKLIFCFTLYFVLWRGVLEYLFSFFAGRNDSTKSSRI